MDRTPAPPHTERGTSPPKELGTSQLKTVIQHNIYLMRMNNKSGSEKQAILTKIIAALRGKENIVYLDLLPIIFFVILMFISCLLTSKLF